jgi:hypothetical protein
MKKDFSQKLERNISVKCYRKKIGKIIKSQSSNQETYHPEEITSRDEELGLHHFVEVIYSIHALRRYDFSLCIQISSSYIFSPIRIP